MLIIWSIIQFRSELIHAESYLSYIFVTYSTIVKSCKKKILATYIFLGFLRYWCCYGPEDYRESESGIGENSSIKRKEVGLGDDMWPLPF